MNTHVAIAVLAGLVLLAYPRSASAQSEPAAPAPAETSEVTPPVLLRNAEPVYPPAALQEGRTGSVLLVLDIDAQGRVTNATVKEPAGFGFDEAAQEAAYRLEFTPARRQGKDIPARILYRTRFDVQPPAPPPPPAATAPAPTATLAGTVRLADLDAPLAGAVVRVLLADGRALQTRTDAQGRWELAGVDPGAVSVEVSALGYSAAAFAEQVSAGEKVELIYRLRAEAQPLEVVVRGAQPEREVTKRTMRRQELALVPGTSGDALRAVQALPSVARTDAFSGLIVVRGSAPSGTAVFVDGTPVPIAYHFGGLSSVVPTEMIEAIDFFPGNFSARYGRVGGGIVDVRLRELDHGGKLHGLAQVDLIDARLMLSGPVPLLDAWSFSLAGRRSHVDAWISGLMSDFATVRRAPVYYDWQAFAQTRPTEGSLLRIGMFGSDDRLSLLFGDAIPQDPGMGTSMTQRTGMMRWQAIYRNTMSESVKLSATASAGIDRDQISFGSIHADTTYRPIALRGELSWKMARTLTLRAGPDVVFTNYTADVRTMQPPDPGSPDPGPLSARPLLIMNRTGWSSTPAAYAEVLWKPVTALELLFGGRVDHDQLTGATDVSPRFNARYDVHEGFPRSTLKTGVGMFYEPPQPVESSDVFGTPSLQSNRSVHSSVGFEQELSEAVDVSVEVFWKELDDLVVRQGQADGSLGYDNLGEGRVVGGELLLRHRPVGRFFGWLAYTLSRSTRIDAPGEAEHLFEYDQTHILTALGSYDLGRGWRAGARFRLVTGNPYTPCLGGVQNAGSGTYACRSGEPYSQRLPAYHQADARVDKTWTFGAFRLTAYLDVQNVYNRANPEAVEYNYNYTRARYQAGLPILPSLGLRGEF